MDRTVISFSHLEKSFVSPTGRRVILNDVNFSVQPGSFVTIFGPNGCGKSTLVKMLGGLETPDRGSIVGAHAMRGKIGFVFQDYRRTLLPWLDVEENILFPLRLRGVRIADGRRKLNELVGLTQFRCDLKQRAFLLSGGQAQMVSLLRALIIEPELLILDEPFSALDYGRTLLLRETLSTIAEALGLTVIFISHDLDEALYLGDQVVFLTKSPTTVSEILTVSHARPRKPELLGSSEFSALKLRALKIFQACCEGIE